MKTNVRIYLRKEDQNLTESEILRSIQEWEAEKGKNLPSDYRKFLLSYIGGFPFPNCFDVSLNPLPEFLDENPQAIYEFYDWLYIQKLISTNHYYSGYPDGYMVIADAISPIHLLMGVRDDNWGKLFLWYHSTVEWGDEINNERDLVFAANNFSELLLSFYDDGEEITKSQWEKHPQSHHAVFIEI